MLHIHRGNEVCQDQPIQHDSPNYTATHGHYNGDNQSGKFCAGANWSHSSPHSFRVAKSNCRSPFRVRAIPVAVLIHFLESSEFVIDKFRNIALGVNDESYLIGGRDEDGPFKIERVIVR